MKLASYVLNLSHIRLLCACTLHIKVGYAWTQTWTNIKANESFYWFAWSDLQTVIEWHWLKKRASLTYVKRANDFFLSSGLANWTCQCTSHYLPHNMHLGLESRSSWTQDSRPALLDSTQDMPDSDSAFTLYYTGDLRNFQTIERFFTLGLLST